MKVIDLTHTITEGMPVFPGTEEPQLSTVAVCENDGYRETLLRLTSHTGTHVDAPAHIFAEGKNLDQFPADQFIGKAVVIDCRHLKEGDFITMKEIESASGADEADFLLFNTGWDKFWNTPKYFGDYPCINEKVLNFVLSEKYKGIGFDVLGIDPISDVSLFRHKRLFENKDIINIENLKNLHLCGKGLFDFCCLPMKFKNSDGAPARAIAWRND